MNTAELYREIETIGKTSLKEVQKLYNVDSKEEIIALIEEEIVAAKQCSISETEYNEWDEHGFADEIDYWRFVA